MFAQIKIANKMKKLLIVLFLALGATCAMSQSAFQGFYGQVTAGYGTTTPTSNGGSGTFVVRGTTYPFTFVTDHNTSGDFMATATVGYMFKISKKFLLGIGAEFTQNVGPWTTIVTTTTNTSNNVKTIDEYKISHSHNFFLSPSYVIDKDKLVFVKFGYTGSLTKNEISGSVNEDHKTRGYSLGLGYKQIIKRGWYGIAEGDYYRSARQRYSNSGVSAAGYPFTSSMNIGSHSFHFQVGIGYTMQRKKPNTKQK
jgi:outer membrane immunogenic protein